MLENEDGTSCGRWGARIDGMTRYVHYPEARDQYSTYFSMYMIARVLGAPKNLPARPLGRMESEPWITFQMGRNSFRSFGLRCLDSIFNDNDSRPRTALSHCERKRIVAINLG